MQIVDTKRNLIKEIPTAGDVTYANCNNDGQIIFTQKTITGEIDVYLTDYKNNSIKQLTSSTNEKRFPTFME